MLYILDSPRMVFTGRDDALAIGAEARASDAALSPPRVPDPRRWVMTGGDDAPAARTEARAVDGALRSGELGQHPPVL